MMNENKANACATYLKFDEALGHWLQQEDKTLTPSPAKGAVYVSFGTSHSVERIKKNIISIPIIHQYRSI